MEAREKFDLSRVGERVESPPIKIDGDATKAFADATNDDNYAFSAGDLVPPLYPVVLVLKTMVAAKNTVTRAFAFHGEHDLSYLEHFRPGMVVVPSATVVGVRQRSAGVAIIVRIAIHSQAGNLLNEQYFTSFVSGGRIEESVGEDAPRRTMAQLEHERPPLGAGREGPRREAR